MMIQSSIRQKSRTTAISAVVAVFLCFISTRLSAQVISNNGAIIQVSTGTYVFSNYLNNNTGEITNHGTFDLNSDLNNTGILRGNGFYNLNGNWIDHGTFNPGTSHVTFKRTTGDQIIEHIGSGESFFNLTLDNPFNIYQTSLPGGSLNILNDLNLARGTLRLHESTEFLNINRSATIAGNLVYNGLTTQIVTIGGDLTGAGTMDMRGGDLDHILNLAGAVNQIGTFLTGPGESIVNYNGTGNQTVFPAMNYRHLIISNGGIKTLQGNSVVNLNLSITGGTFDLGTVATDFDVSGSTSIAGSLSFNGTTNKTVDLFGNLTGAGSINMSGGNLPHILNLNGPLNSIGSYSSGAASTVVYTLNGDQTVFSSNDYRNLIIQGSDRKTLLGDVNTKGVLTMLSGDIDAGSYLLEVSNPALTAINRTAGKVIGKLRRAVNTTSGEYLYPVGSLNYNPFKIRFQQLNAGSLTVQFKQEDIGNEGLPLDDNGNEIYERYTTGYWTLSSSSPSLTNRYNIKADFEGFSPTVDASASIIKRTNNGSLEIDGEHGGLTADEISRNNLVNGISTGTTDIGIGRGRPRIVDEPTNIDICETFNAFFEVDARGRGTLTYQWEVSIDGGVSFAPVVNGGVYSGATTYRLVITGAPYSMTGYRYRCVITDGQGHTNTTAKVLLTVNKIPEAVATPSAQDECPGVAFTTIELTTSNNVPGTTFAWVRDNLPGLSTTMPMSGSAEMISENLSVINGTFSNTGDSPVTVTFRIIPTGPAKTFCVGDEIIATVTVNPIPKVRGIPENSTQCDNTATNIRLTSPSVFTSGVVTFRYTVTTSGNVTGFTSPSTGMLDEHHITDVLVNNTDTYQTVTYRVTPMSPVGCIDGMPVNLKVTVNPTPKVEPLNSRPEICYGGTTQIILTTPTTMTTGSVVFDYTVSATGGGVVTGNMSAVDDASPGHTIARIYKNSSHDLQSVYYTITPVNNSICPPGPPVISEVKVHAIPIWDIEQIKPLTCDGGAGLGALRAKLSTGAGPYHIIWNGPDNYHKEDQVEIENLSSGAYYATVTDNLACPGKDTAYLVPQYAEPYFYAYMKSPGGNHVSCIGATDGRIRIGVQSGITAPYSYRLLKNDTEVIGTGVFIKTVSEGESQEFGGLEAGVYTLVITDKYGCERIRSVTLKPPPPINVTFGKRTYPGEFNISCRGYNDGSVWVEKIEGGRGGFKHGFKYRWFTSDGFIPGPVNANRIDNVAAGTYYLEVTDTLNCQAIFPVTITQPEGMELASFLLSSSPDNAYNISCHGNSDGSISINVRGGSGTYSYSWTGPDGFTSSQKDISGLNAGVYNCTVTDMNGCILSPVPSFTLTQPASLTVSTVTSVSADGAYQINCHGGTGSILATVSGGSLGNYTYTWSTADGLGIAQGNRTQTTLTAGTYHLDVRDMNNCVVSTHITLAEPPAVKLDLVPEHITCEATGFNNGAINLIVTGGAGPMTYQWSNGATTRDISGLTEGVYRVDVTYNNTCIETGSVRVNLPPPLTYTTTFSNYNSYEISCFGMSNGEIHVTPTGGEAPFSYSWSGPNGFTSSSPDLTGLKAGIYNLKITDANLCTATEIMEMREPGELEARFILSQSLNGGFNLNCAGDSDGTIIVNPQNSVNNVSYLWSDGFMGRNRTNLKAGVYTVVITDDNNCQAVGTVTLTQPDSIKLIYEIRQPFCPDMPDGEIRLNVTGGISGAGYSYKWSDNSTGDVLTGISMGEFKVIVEDINSCVVRDSIMVKPQNEACLIVPNVISPNGDLINDYWNIGMKELYPQMEVKIFNRWGETVWRSARGYPDPWDGRSNGALLPIDSYHYIIDLHNGTKPIVGNVTIVK